MIRLIAAWKAMVIRNKTRKFNREFDRYYNSLLMGELYDAKVNLLTDMKDNRESYLKKYLETGMSVNSQILAFINSLKFTQP